MYYFHSDLCNRIIHNCCCCCFWLIIQMMCSPANRVFSFSKCGWGGLQHHIRRWPSTAWNKHFLHAMYFRCYNNYMIEENYNNKIMFYFLSPNVFIFFNSLMKCFFFLRNSVLCIWLSNEGIKHQFNLSLNYWKLKKVWQTKGIYY